MATCDFRVTLLGTGVPIPSPDRFGPCTLVEAGDQKFLVDAGRGATIRLYQLKLPIGRIDVQLLTHYHSDHTSGIPTASNTGAASRCFPAIRATIIMSSTMAPAPICWSMRSRAHGRS